MRAAVVEELTGPDAVRVRDFPEPEGPHPMADGQRVLVEVHAASVSFPDLLQSRGCYQIATDPPYVSGGEFAGVVVEADPETGFAPGETVLVQGAAGGVGTVAIEVLKDLAARCIAVVSSDEKERVAREVGADEVVRSTAPWLEQVRALTGGRGVGARVGLAEGAQALRIMERRQALGKIVVDVAPADR
jgi:NADPH2:quinone reductase